VRYLSFLSAVHELLEPQRYLEIGVRHGHSLALASCRAVGIDPAFTLSSELDCDLALFRTTSDEYFGRPDPLAATGGKPFDLAFIDGLHLFEFALRDFMHVEKHSSPRSVIVFDDMLPRTIDEAARVRHTAAWTGDVYPVLAVFAKYRPDLIVIPVGTQPTGLLLVMGLDPANTTLADNYQAIIDEFRTADPQPVPPELLDRRTVVAPQRVLSAGFWQVLANAAEDVSPAALRPDLARAVAASVGPAFAPEAAIAG
jgi:hypothetical protein